MKSDVTMFVSRVDVCPLNHGLQYTNNSPSRAAISNADIIYTGVMKLRKMAAYAHIRSGSQEDLDGGEMSFQSGQHER